MSEQINKYQSTVSYKQTKQVSYQSVPREELSSNFQYPQYSQSSEIDRESISSTVFNSVNEMHYSSVQRDSIQLMRRNLGENLDVVCFIMVIELERLLYENDKLKYRIKEIEDRGLDRNSYENQIRDLQRRIDEMSNEINTMLMIKSETTTTITHLESQVNYWKEKTFESEQLKAKYFNLENLNQSLTIELEQMRSRMKLMEDQKYREIEQVRVQFESERQTYIEREVTVIQNNFNADRRYLEQEVKKTKDQLQSKQKEIEDLQFRIQQSQQIFEQTRDSDVKIMTLEKENERLQQVITKKNEEQEIWKQKYNRLEQSSLPQITNLQNTLKILEKTNQEIIIKNQQLQNEIERLNLILKEKLLTLENCQKQFVQLQSQVDVYKEAIIKLEQHNPVKDKQIQDQQLEIENLRQTLKNKLIEIEEFRTSSNRFELLSKQSNQKVSDLEEKIAYLSAEIERLNHLIRQKSLEMDQLNSKTTETITYYTSLIKEKETKITILQQDTEGPKRKISQLENQITQLREKESRLVSLEQNYQALLMDLEKANRKNLESSNELQFLRERSAKQDQQIEDLNQNIDKMQSQMRQKIIENDDYKKSLQGMDSELKKFKLQEQATVTLIDELRIKNATYTNSISELQKQINSYIERIRILEQQIDSLTIFKKKCSDLEQELNVRNSEIMKLASSLTAKETAIDQLLQKIDQLTKMEENIRVLSAEIDRLNEIKRQQEKELATWRLQYSGENSLAKKIQDLLVLNTILFAEVESLRSRVMEKEEEIEEIRRMSLAPYKR